MFGHILSIEIQKFIRQPMMRIALGILAAFAAGIQLIMFAVYRLAPAAAGLPTDELAAQARAAFTWPDALVSAVGMAASYGLGGLLIIVLMGAAVTQEYQFRTLHLWLSRGTPRLTYGLARFTSILLPALLIALTALLASGIASLGLQLLLGEPLPFDQVRPGALLLGALAAAYTLLPYAGLAFFLGVATRSTAATIAAGISILLLAENLLAQILALIGGIAAAAGAYLPVRLAAALVAGGAPEGGPALAPGLAALGLALYTLLFVGLAVGKLYRQDLTAG